MRVKLLACAVMACAVIAIAVVEPLAMPARAKTQAPQAYEISEVLVARSNGGTGPDMLTSAAFCAGERLVFAQSRNNAAVALNEQGKALWRRPFRGEITSVTCAGPRVYAVVAEDEWMLYVLSLRTGVVEKVTMIDTQRAERVKLVGPVAGRVALQVEATVTPFGPPKALQYPTRTVRLYDVVSDTFEDVFVAIDSTPQVAPALGESRNTLAIRTPFAARPSIAVTGDSAIVYSNGYSFVIQYRAKDGRLLKADTLNGSIPKWSAELLGSMIEQWRSARATIFPDSLLRRAAAMDSTRRGLSIGQVVGSPTGELLVHRRDVDENPVDTRSKRRYDIRSAAGASRGWFTLPVGTVAHALSGDRVVAIRTILTGTKPARFSRDELVVFRLRPPDAR